MLSTAEIVLNSLIVLHFVGLASLLGGFLVQIKALKSGEGKIVAAMNHGAWTMLITGLALVGVHEWISALDPAAVEIDNLKIAVKSIVLTLVLVLVMHYRKKATVKSSILALIGALTFTNIVLAVFW